MLKQATILPSTRTVLVCSFVLPTLYKKHPTNRQNQTANELSKVGGPAHSHGRYDTTVTGTSGSHGAQAIHNPAHVHPACTPCKAHQTPTFKPYTSQVYIRFTTTTTIITTYQVTAANNRPTNHSTNQPTNQPFDKPNNQPSNHSTNQPIKQPTNQSFD